MKKFVLGLMLVFVGSAAFAQANLLNAKSPEEFVTSEEQKLQDNDNPLPYPHVSDRELLWYKTVWEIIDLDERLNFPLYYPVDTVNIGPQRRSLFHVLVKAVEDGKLDMYNNSYFTSKRELKDLTSALSAMRITDAGVRQLNEKGVFLPDNRSSTIDSVINAGILDRQFVQRRDIQAADVKQYRIKGVWYFDSRQGEMRYRLLGIAPVTPDASALLANQATGSANPVTDYIPLFWIFYPQAREVLHEALAFNGENTARSITFDHLLNVRRFDSMIYKVDNVQGDREIERYIADNAMMQLLESQRIQEDIRNFELDLWNY